MLKVIEFDYDSHCNKTHLRIETSEFTDWYWVGGKVTRLEALELLTPMIHRQLGEFRSGLADTPHGIETAHCCGLI